MSYILDKNGVKHIQEKESTIAWKIISSKNGEQVYIGNSKKGYWSKEHHAKAALKYQLYRLERFVKWVREDKEKYTQEELNKVSIQTKKDVENLPEFEKQLEEAKHFIVVKG